MSTLPRERENEEGGVATIMATKKVVATKIHVKVVDEQAEKLVRIEDVPVGTVFTGSIEGNVGTFVAVELPDDYQDAIFSLDKLCLLWFEFDDEIKNYKVRHDVKIEVK